MYALIVSTMLAAGTPVPKLLPTADFIRALKPETGPARARSLAKLIDRWASYYGVDPALMVSIIRQETGFRSGIRACWKAPWKGPEGVTCDHGIAQVNEVWVEKWSLDAEKLITDDDYNIRIQARVLAWYQRYFGLDQAWPGRYHSGKPALKASYLAKIQAFMALSVVAADPSEVAAR